MIRAFFFMMKVGLVVAAAVWVASRPGTVSLAWMGYTFHVHVGLFLLVIFITILLAISIYSFLQAISDLPKIMRRYQEKQRREKGYRALTLGLTAVAAGDAKNAAYQSYRTLKYLSNDNGLPMLLKAQSARLLGKEDEAREAFIALLDNKDAAFLGVRGLLQGAVDRHDYTKALELSRRALEIHPKQPWILRLVYDLEVRSRSWEQARMTLYRAEKSGAISHEQARSDRTAMLLAEGDRELEKGERDKAFEFYKKAHKADPNFVPGVERLAKFYIQKNKRRAAVSVIEKAWRANPHPDLVALWDIAAPKFKLKDSAARLKWFEKLLAVKPESAEGRMAAARAAMDEGFWGEARNYLGQAEQAKADARLYRLWAELEDRSTQNEDVAQRWLDKALESPPAKVWICKITGRIYREWAPIALPHGSFNTMVWADPDLVAEEAQELSGAGLGGSYLEAPKA